MKKTFLILVIVGFIWALGVGTGLADTINLQTLPSSTYNGYYVGGVGGNINGGHTMSFYCNDFSTTTYVPSSFAVAVSTLSDLSQTKFGGTPNALSRYQQAGWLISQMELNPSQVGPIQYALWSVFNSSTPSPPGAANWLSAASSINPAQFDFSSVRVYTATNTVNQEFISGGAHALPEPSIILLLSLGLGCLVLVKRRLQKKTALRV
ncbi:MAG: PEP-CTERM sorting domain-containing protein [Proteobacteria bacterium]|nr:PEP-CTERM sorting domain-containing protein [Pseudomonadota bacterium]